MEGQNIGFTISHLVSHFKNMKRIIINQFQHQRNLALSEVFQIVSSEIVITLMYQLFPPLTKKFKMFKSIASL